MELAKRSFTAGELSPNLRARADLNKYATGASTLKNFFIHAEGGVSSRAGFGFTGYVKDNAATFRLIPFQYNTEQTYVLEFTNLAMRVIKDGGYVLENAVTITGITNANPAVVTAASHGFSNGDTVYISSAGGISELNNGWYVVANQTANTFELAGIDSTSLGVYTSGGTVSRVYTKTTPYASADLADLKFTQSADVMTFVHPSFDPTELSRTGHTSWTFATVSYASTVSAPTWAGTPLVAGGSGAGSYNKTYDYVLTAVVDGVESLQSSKQSLTTPSLSTTAYIQASWNAVSGADYYNIYKATSDGSNVYGWIGKSATTSFRDYNIGPIVDDTPPQDKDPFAGANNKPSTVNYYQQRILFASSNNDPQTVWTSQSGNYNSMRVSSPSKDDDAITFTIASQKVNEVRHIVALDALLLLTSGGEWVVTEGQEEVLTPSTAGVKPQSYYGASNVAPVLIGSDAIYIQERGSRVRSIGYTFEADSYTGSDLSILAQHLFADYNIIEMAYSQEPNSTIYALRDDGVLLVCTYHKEHQVVGWYRYETAGLIKSMTVIAEGNVDVLYIGVERTINGQTRRYVERLHERNWAAAEDAFCIDSGLFLDALGGTTSTVYGLHNLEGEEVIVLADGNVVRGKTITNGVLTLDRPASKIAIGLPYECDIETLDIDTNEQNGYTPRGKKKSVSEVTFYFLDSRGGYVGKDANSLTEIKPRFDSDNYDDIQLRTYEFTQVIGPGWTDGGHVYFRQSDPLPVTILLVAPELAIG